MIEHLRGREQALASLGWTGREAEWIALVCLHSGVFTRAQFCHYFEVRRNAAHRIVRTLIERREAVEGEWPLVNGARKDVPNFKQRDLPCARSREHPPPAKGQPERRDAAASLA